MWSFHDQASASGPAPSREDLVGTGDGPDSPWRRYRRPGSSRYPTHCAVGGARLAGELVPSCDHERTNAPVVPNVTELAHVRARGIHEVQVHPCSALPPPKAIVEPSGDQAGRRASSGIADLVRAGPVGRGHEDPRRAEVAVWVPLPAHVPVGRVRAE